MTLKYRQPVTCENVFTFRPGTDMNHKWSLLGVGKFYTAEEALSLLRNMSDFEDESTSESKIEGDSSDSSEYAPEQQSGQN